MKKLLFACSGFALYSCHAGKEIQVEFVNAELVRIDTVVRYPTHQQVLFWKGSNNMEYISYVPINTVYPVGKKMTVMIQK